MKWCFALLALTLYAQSDSKEKALGLKLREDVLKESKPVTNETAIEYLRQVASRFTPAMQIDLIEFKAADPIALPGGFILVPANALRNAKSETEFLRALAHAVAHLELRHGFTQKGDSAITLIFWSGIHPDPMRPSTIPVALRKQQAEFEQQADEYASKTVAAVPDSEAFLAARRALQP